MSEKPKFRRISNEQARFSRSVGKRDGAKKKVTFTVSDKGTVFTRAWTDGTPDEGAIFTERAYNDMASRLRVVYQSAADDLLMKQTSWLQAHEKRVAKYRAMVEAGMLSEEDYQAWMQGQLFQERAWALKRGQLARTMVDIDQQAIQMINDGKIDVFCENANFIGFTIEQQTGGAAATFGLYDRQAFARLVRDQPYLLPMPEIDEKKDYDWYNRVITNAVTQGILQGESLDEIVLRVAEDTGETALHAMRRNARTAYTGAQNAGRIEGMRQARDELNIPVKKRWLATLDDKTRDAHAALDGQEAEIDEPFESLLGPIMYPGDPDAAPANVYNCRCTLEEVPAGHRWEMRRRDGETGEIVGDMSYKEWLKQKAK